MTNEQYNRVMDLVGELENLGVPREALFPIVNDAAKRRAQAQSEDLESREPEG